MRYMGEAYAEEYASCNWNDDIAGEGERERESYHIFISTFDSEVASHHLLLLLNIGKNPKFNSYAPLAGFY